MRASWSLLVLLVGCGRMSFETLDDARDPSGDADSVVLDGDGGLPAGPPRVVARGSHTCATFGGALYCWGENGDGQLGDGTLMDRARPTRVQLPAGTLQAFAVGELSSCAIVDGVLYCWGDMFTTLPIDVPLPESPVTSVALGEDFVCALANQTYCWGANNVGQLGNGTFGPQATPMPVLGAPHRSLTSGEDHVCALKVTGGVECWGHNDDGVLGFGAFTPVDVSLPQAVDPVITTLPSIGALTACAVEGTTVLCWGTNMNGELGTATGGRSATPVVVPNHPPAWAVASGGSPTNYDAICSVDLMGVVRCWGWDNSGRLGNGMPGTLQTPTVVNGLPSAAYQVTVGAGHSCAALADTDIWCWGRGTSGQLGTGATSSSLVPVRVVPPP